MKKLTAYETLHALTGQPPQNDDPNVGCYLARLVESDARKAEAYADTYPEVDVLQKIRTHMSRGSFAEVQKLLAANHVEDPEVRSELLLESARLATFRGDWQTALQLGAEALELQPIGPTRMTIHQVRALALFELAEFARAKHEIEKARSLAKLFPLVGLSFYLDATAIKVEARLGNLAGAEALLETSWARLRASPTCNADGCLTLMRSELDLRRLKGGRTSSLAFATWLLAKAMGENLYEQLAVLDLHFALPEKQRAYWHLALSAALDYDPRIQLLFQGNSVSAKSLVAATPDDVFSKCPSDATKTLVLYRRGIRIDLNNLKLSRFKITAQTRDALHVLATGPMDKENFFRSLWGISRFTPHLHDDVIRRLLHRLRKIPLEVVTQDSKIEIVDAHLVDA